MVVALFRMNPLEYKLIRKYPRVHSRESMRIKCVIGVPGNCTQTRLEISLSSRKSLTFGLRHNATIYACSCVYV